MVGAFRLLRFAGILAFLLCCSAWAQPVHVEGLVRDSTGAPVVSAEVTLRAGAFAAKQSTDRAGKFAFLDVPASSGTMRVQAAGFAVVEQSWSGLNPGRVQIEIVLSLSPVTERVLVSAARAETRLADTPASSVLLSRRDLEATPALTLDDTLRQVPGFTLFRRSGSRTANPTTQGVSLRGLGASGASRALVLRDGVPLNDPFGGWVYWDRTPRAALSDVEIVRGGTSSLYGSDALSGVIQFRSREPQAPAVSFETSYGSEVTPDLSLWTGTRAGRWSGHLSADLFRTDGYILVPFSQRGAVDTAANSKHGTGEVGFGYQYGSGKVFARGSFFDEARHNGTPLQVNNTRIGEGVAGADADLSSLGSFSVRIYGDAQSYSQTFSAIAQDRMSESLTNAQQVPSQQAGGSGQWVRAWGKSQTLVAGFEVQEVIGSSHEQIFSFGEHRFTNVSGGRQRTAGVFGEDIIRAGSKWVLLPSVRFDAWRNFNAQSVRVPFSPPGPPTLTPFPERTETAFSPRLGVLRSLTPNISAMASVYRAFRAPTLNELYRTFRVGNVVTQNNPDLGPERLTGAEAGFTATLLRRKLDVRSTFFWSDIVNPIANVTLSVTPTLITRQRQNLGRTRSRGVEFDGVVHLTGKVEVSGGYQFADATVVRFPANASLEGLQIPQVPHHQFTLQARYWNPSRLMLSVQGRFVSGQFEDDRNTMLLERYFVLDMLAGRSLGHGVEIFGAIENLLNQRYSVGLTPVPTLGPPLLARIGLRFNYPPR